MRYVLIIILLLTGCTSVSDIQPAKPSIGYLTSQSPRYYPAKDYIEGKVVEIPTLREGKYLVKITPTNPDNGEFAFISIWSDTPLFILENGITHSAEIGDINISNVIFAYPDGTISTLSPMIFKSAEIIISR